MIPKTIHYCWYGNTEKPKSVTKCLNSWKRYCDNFEIIEWNENNTDISKFPYVKKAYEMNKWAFVTDYMRMLIIYQNGGIYLDTDVELLKPLDSLLELDAFIGFESYNRIASGLGFGASPGNRLFKEVLEYYDSLDVDSPDFRFLACPQIETTVFRSHGLDLNGQFQTVDNVTVFPVEYFSPYDYETGRLTITDNTVSIHHYDATWKSNKEKLNTNIHRLLNRIKQR